MENKIISENANKKLLIEERKIKKFIKKYILCTEFFDVCSIQYTILLRVNPKRVISQGLNFSVCEDDLTKQKGISVNMFYPNLKTNEVERTSIEVICKDIDAKIWEPLFKNPKSSTLEFVENSKNKIEELLANKIITKGIRNSLFATMSRRLSSLALNLFIHDYAGKLGFVGGEPIFVYADSKDAKCFYLKMEGFDFKPVNEGFAQLKGTYPSNQLYSKYSRTIENLYTEMGFRKKFR